MTLKDNLSTIIALAAVASLGWGSIQYFATAEDLRLVEMRLDQKIVADQSIDLKRRQWQLEDRNKDKGKDCVNWSESDRESYRRIIEDIRVLEQKQQELMKK